MKNHFKNQSRNAGIAGGNAAPQAFTLIGLLAVLAVSAFLAALMLPMLSRAKQLSRTSVCANNLRQLGMGINDYADDNKQMFPPAAFELIGLEGPYSWDSLINHYIGGNLTIAQLTADSLSPTVAPKTLRCPDDTGLITGLATGLDSVVARRSYSMSAFEPGGFDEAQCAPPFYPPLPQPRYGIGVCWEAESGVLDLHPPSYLTRVIQDAAGTILLAENANGNNYAGYAWFSVCSGPTNSGTGIGSDWMYQLDAGDPWCYGSNVYQAQGNKFNYLFHDNHVSILTWQQTLGTTPSNHIPNGPYLGMWSITAGD